MSQHGYAISIQCAHTEIININEKETDFFVEWVHAMLLLFLRTLQSILKQLYPQ